MQAEQQSERERFEADAGPYGFDLTRCELSLSGEPWTEYRDSGTGHRWAGWLAARNPHQVPAALSHQSTPQGWQPISTAPKDGTPIIIARIQDCMVYDVCNGSIEVVAEDEEDGPWDMRGGEPWCRYRGRPAGTYFCCWLPDFEREDRWLMTAAFEYTHWTATPPPEQGGKG